MARGDKSAPVTVIRPRSGILQARPGELWQYRELLLRLTARDITLRYRQTLLGVTWVIAQPLLGAGILTFVFGTVADLRAPAGVPYFAFSLTGMVIWNLFSQTTLRASVVLLGNAALVQKVFFPRLALPLSAALSTLVDLAVSLSLVAVAIAISGVTPGLAILTAPIWLAAAMVAGLGLGLATGALMVRYRDVQHVVPVLIQLLLFLSPVAYTLSSVPAEARGLYELNPLAGLIEGFRWSLLDVAEPTIELAAYAVGISGVILLLGLVVFGRMERAFADVI